MQDLQPYFRAVGILKAIRQLIRLRAATSRPIGFVTPKNGKNKPQARAAKRS